MNSIKLKGQTKVCGIVVPEIAGGFGENKKSMLAKHIAEIHGRQQGHVNEAINSNRDRFIDGVDVIDVKQTDFAIGLVDSGFISQNALNALKNLYLISERGYAKLLKIFDDDLAWDKYEELLDGYFRMREEQPKSQLEILQASINQLVEQERRMNQVEQRLDGITEIIGLNATEWRKKVNTIINKIAKARGGHEAYQDVRNESYTKLEERAKCQLSIRLTNKKQKMALEGVPKSKIDKVTKMDVIADDARLTEIYLAIVKEMAIQYRVDVSDLSNPKE